MKCDDDKKQEFKNKCKNIIAKKMILNAEKSDIIKRVCKTVEYNGKKYLVGETNGRKKNTIFVFDYKFKNIAPYINFNSNIQDYIVSQKRYKKISTKLSLHNLVMNHLKFRGDVGYTVDHINRIETDNRLENLRFATHSEQNHNQKMKERKNTLPKNCGVLHTELPRCVSYKKANGSDFFSLVFKNFPGVGKIEKCSTKKSKKSTKYKFEDIKGLLRHLKSKYPDGFRKMHIESEKSENIINLENDYYEILKLAGHNIANNGNGNDDDNDDKCNSIIKADYETLTDKEITELQTKNYEKVLSHVKDNILPDNCGVTEDMLGKYIKYFSESPGRGSYFAIVHHPKNNGKKIYCTSRRTTSIYDKYMDAIKRLKRLEES